MLFICKVEHFFAARNVPIAFMVSISMSLTIQVCLKMSVRSVYKELHADRETGAADNKQAEYQAPGKCGIFSLFCCQGFPKGLAPWHTTLLAKCRAGDDLEKNRFAVSGFGNC